MSACFQRPRKWIQVGSVATIVWAAGTWTRTVFPTRPTCGQRIRVGLLMLSRTTLHSGTTRTMTATVTTSSTSTARHGVPPIGRTVAVRRRAPPPSTDGAALTPTAMDGPTRHRPGWPVPAGPVMLGPKIRPNGTTATATVVGTILEEPQPMSVLL